MVPGWRIAGWAFASAGCCRLLVSCLDIAETSPSADGGAGTGGSVLADSPWGTGGTSETGSGGASGDAGSGTGGFVSVACDTCAGTGKCECVPEAPTGWSYVRVADGKQTKCPETAATPVLVGTGAVDTGCQGCECGSVIGGSCGIRHWVDFNNTYCSNLQSAQVHNVAGQCVPFSSSGTSMRLSAALAGGSCDPGTAQPSAPAFAAPKTLCKASSGGACGVGGACIPQEVTPFGATACVMFDSQGVDVECPSGYPSKVPYSTGFDDTRKCTCQCKTSGGCSGGVAHYGCTSGSGNDLDACKPFQSGDFLVVTLPTLSSGGCSPDGAATVKSGSVAASGLRVVCCR